MDVLKSKKLSLFCALLNGIFAASSFMNGDMFFGLIALAFCGLCTRNYLYA